MQDINHCRVYYSYSLVVECKNQGIKKLLVVGNVFLMMKYFMESTVSQF